MITILLAFIKAKYKCDYGMLFIGTVIIDVELINLLLCKI